MQISEYFQSVLLRGFRNESRHMPGVTHQQDFLLSMFHGIQYRAKIAGDFGNRQSFHVPIVCDAVSFGKLRNVFRPTGVHRRVIWPILRDAGVGLSSVVMKMP